MNGVSARQIYFCFFIDFSVSYIGKFATTEKGLVEGWYDVDHVGWCPHIDKSLVAVAVPPVGRMKTLVDRVVVSSKES